MIKIPAIIVSTLMASAIVLALMTTPQEVFAAPPPVANLIAAYPDQFRRIENNELVWSDGTRMAISDSHDDKSFDDRLDHPAISDMFSIPYRRGPASGALAFNEDPGRIRYEPLFMKMYGDCTKGEVEAHLRKVPWPTPEGMGSVLFTTVNHAADQLEAVINELQKLPKEYTRYFIPDNGTYMCRMIAGTNRRSMHAYGAAIDINKAFGDYWRLEKSGTSPLHYRNRIPFEIVDIFERHGFIWGGKWYHYDTLHFEYRPELLQHQ